MIPGFFSAGAMGEGGGPPPSSGHRYWRLLITANDGGPFFGLSELGLRDTIGGASIVDSAERTNSASASSFVNSDNNPTKAFDGNTTSEGWLSATPVPSWIKWDFDFQLPGGPYPNIVQYSINGSWNSPTSSPQDFELQWSDDNSSWITADSVTGQTGWTGGTDLRIFTV